MNTNGVYELLRKAEDAYSNKEWASGVRHASLATQMEPRNVNAWRLLGQGFDEWGQPDKAIPPIEQAIEIEPASADLHAALGELYTKSGDSEKGLTELRRATECPNGNRKELDYARALVTASHYDEARAVLQRIRSRYKNTNLGGPESDRAALEEFGYGPSAVDTVEAHLILDEAVKRNCAPVSDTGEEMTYFPANWTAVQALEKAVLEARSLSLHDADREYIDSVEELIRNSKKRMWEGGIAVPLSAGALGLLFVLSGASSPVENAAAAVTVGLFYLACVPLYIHASRPMKYKLYSRALKGGKGIGDLLSTAGRYASKKDATTLAFNLTVLVGAICGVLFTPAFVIFKYIRNYVLK